MPENIKGKPRTPQRAAMYRRQKCVNVQEKALPGER